MNEQVFILYIWTNKQNCVCINTTLCSVKDVADRHSAICWLQTACSRMFQGISRDKDVVVPFCNSIDSLHLSASSAEPALWQIAHLAHVAVGLAVDQHHGSASGYIRCCLCCMCYADRTILVRACASLINWLCIVLNVGQRCPAVPHPWQHLIWLLVHAAPGCCLRRRPLRVLKSVNFFALLSRCRCSSFWRCICIHNRTKLCVCSCRAGYSAATIWLGCCLDLGAAPRPALHEHTQVCRLMSLILDLRLYKSKTIL